MESKRYMNNKEIEMRLKNASEALYPTGGSAAEKLWDMPVEKATGSEWFLDGTGSETRTRPGKENKGTVLRISQTKMHRWALSIAACLVAGLAVFYHMSISTYATVYLDINPSYSIGVNRLEKVLSAEADNADGAEVLEGLHLKNMKIEKAVRLICEATAAQGYIQEKENAVLLSVGSSNARAGDLRSRLSEEVERVMNEAAVSGTIYEQDLDEDELDDAAEELAEQYGMTPAKALLLDTVVKDNPELVYEDLAGLSVRELQQQLKNEGSDLRDYTLWRGADPDDYEDILEELLESAGYDEDRFEEVSEQDPDDADEDDADEEGSYEREDGTRVIYQSISVNDGSGVQAAGGYDRDDSGDDAYETEDHDADDSDRDKGSDSEDSDSDDGDSDDGDSGDSDDD